MSLLSYGYNPATIFWSILLSSIELATLVLLVAAPVSVVMLTLIGVSLSPDYILLLFYFSIPISYASVMLMTIIGMIWSSMTVRRQGVNSPVGLAPLFGIIPIALSVFLSILAPGLFLTIGATISAGIFVVVGMLLALVSRGMLTTERFLPSS